MKSFLFLLLFSICTLCLCAQNIAEPSPRVNEFLQATAAFGSQEGTGSFAWVYNWRVGKKRKLEAGLGLRWTSYLGNNKEFYTAPAKFARSTSIPLLVVFSGHEEQNVDTFIVDHARTNSLNLSLNVGYHFGAKWYAGANIDMIGFTFGSRSQAVLQSDGVHTYEPSASPSPFNLLLTGDDDIGALNSEFYITYQVASRWSIKLAYSFFFTEYKSENIHQTAPDGSSVYRFRNKANLLGLGVSYNIRLRHYPPPV